MMHGKLVAFPGLTSPEASGWSKHCVHQATFSLLDRARREERCLRGVDR